MKAAVYNIEGKESGSIELPEDIFGLSWNADLVHQVAISMMSNQRRNTAEAKDRGDVRGGGKKPWRQKGTGRARHGSKRSPIWVGGGVTHGPTVETNYSKKINKRMKAKALLTILSKKIKDGEIVFVDQVNFNVIKTKKAQEFLDAMSGIFEKINWKSGKRAIISIPEKDDKVRKSFRNIKSVMVDETRNVNPLDLLKYKYVVFADPEKTVDQIKGRIK